MNIGVSELILIVVLAIILYGKRLPEITRALGKGYNEFKKNVDNVKNDFQKQVEDSFTSDQLGSTSKIDKDYTDALAKNNKLAPVTQSDLPDGKAGIGSKSQDKNLAG